MDKLSELFWENVPTDNLIYNGSSKIEETGLDDLPMDLIDELRISRDENYGIKVSCSRNINILNNKTPSKKGKKKEYIPGETVIPGELMLRPFGNSSSIVFSPCYYSGCVSSLNKTEYHLSCYRIESKYTTKPVRILKEWILNGGHGGLRFCTNRNYKFTAEATVYGTYGDLEFPVKEAFEEKYVVGNYTHFEFRDTAFDVHYVGNNYGPEWSENLSISYFEKYGRIPNERERKIIRDYLSFIVGTKLLLIGNSTYDDNGNQLGFVMESPQTYSFEIERICKNAATPPINDRYESLQEYFDTVQKYLEPFADLYEQLDFDALFGSYWYAKSIAKPYDLPILSGALEHLMKRWYEQVELNPETVLMDKKEFKKRLKAVKESVEEQFKDTDYAERMLRSVEGMNRMTINEKTKHFFERIGMPVGKEEEKALQARNISAHGSFRSMENDYIEQFRMSKIYECIIVRTVLILLGYEGKYIDYGTLGLPEKDVRVPGGDKA